MMLDDNAAPGQEGIGPSSSGDFAFGRFVVQPATRQLLVDGEAAKLGARAFDLLLALIERRDRLVGKNELIDLVWPGLVVEENNLQVQISTLRKLLGPQVIATIPGRGYRFSQKLDSVADREAAGEPTGAATESVSGAATESVSGAAAEVTAPLIGREDDLNVLGRLCSNIGSSALSVPAASARRRWPARWHSGCGARSRTVPASPSWRR
jgi:DNA-binding winged helix-turn-helix (wHTH) protein